MFPVAGCNPVDILSRVAVKWFDSITLHQINAALAEWLGTVLIRRLERERRFNSYRQHQVNAVVVLWVGHLIVYQI